MQIYCDLNAERVGSILYNPQKPQSKHVQAALIAKQNQTVWGMNTDYYTYRVGRKTITGMVIRNGQVFYDRVPEANRHQFPNLDTLAMLEDGSWHVFHSDEHTAQEYLDMGAVDVFSFGPYLIRNGEINPFLAEMKDQRPYAAAALRHRNGGARALLRRVGGGAHPQCQCRRIGRANGRMDAEGRLHGGAQSGRRPNRSYDVHGKANLSDRQI